MKHASCISCVVGALMSDDDSGLKSDLFMLEQCVGGCALGGLSMTVPWEVDGTVSLVVPGVVSVAMSGVGYQWRCMARCQ